jgi:hypothetical protein
LVPRRTRKSSPKKENVARECRAMVEARPPPMRGPDGPSVDQRLQAHRDRLEADRSRLQATAAAKPSCWNSCATCFAKKTNPNVVAIGVPIGQPFAAHRSSPPPGRRVTSMRIEALSASSASRALSAEEAAMDEAAEVEVAAAAARSARATQLAFLGIYDFSPTGSMEAGGDGTFNGEAQFSPRPCLVCSNRRKFSRRREDDTSSVLAEETRAMAGDTRAAPPRNSETGRPRVRFILPCCGNRPPPERLGNRPSSAPAESESFADSLFEDLSDLFSLNCCTARSKGPAAVPGSPPKTSAHKRSVGFEMRNTDI